MWSEDLGCSMTKITRQATLKTNSSTILSSINFIYPTSSHKYFISCDQTNICSKTATPFWKILDQRLRLIIWLPFLTKAVAISPQKLKIVLREVPRETTVQDEHSGARRSSAFGAMARTIAMQSLGTGGCRWSWLLSQNDLDQDSQVSIDIYDTQPRSG